jgi:FAD/FMN-containing dehydrogenase
LVDALRAGCRGGVAARPADCAAAAFDFGAGVTKTPRVTVRPRDVADVAHVVRTAEQFGVPLTSRATAHSLAGQALSDGGIALDMRGLSRVVRRDPDGGWVDAEAGAVWDDVLEASLAAGRAPPVLTSNLFTSVGGTHSVGGLGPASFRHGIQADHCLGLEVVSGRGDVVWCGPGERRELFDLVRCGLGLFGVITRVRVAVEPPAAALYGWRLVYRRASTMLADLLTLAAEPSVVRLSGAGRTLPGRGLRCGWWIDVFTDAAGGAPRARMPAAGLAPVLAAGPHVRSFASVARAGDRTDLRGATAAGPGGHPWVDVILPAAAAADYVEDSVRTLPAALLARSRMLFWPVARGGRRCPLFMEPSGGPLVMASIMPTVPRAEMPDAGARMLALLDLAVAGGAKQYVYGWVPQGRRGWARHFGAAWATVLAGKAAHDPAGLFHPELLGRDA